MSKLSLLRIAGALIWALAAGGVLAADSAAPVRDHDIVAEDYFDLISLGNLQISPDGGHVAYTESRWGRGKEGRHSDLWIVSRKGGDPVRLTFEQMGPGALTWSPDGEAIYFLGRMDYGTDESPYNGSRQIWQIDRTGENLRPVTRAAKSVSRYVLTGDGRTLYYAVSKEVTAEPWRDMREKYSDLEYGHGVTDFHSIYKLDLVGWREELVHNGDRVIWDMDLAADDRHLALITTDDNELIVREGWTRVEILDLETDEITLVAGDDWRDDHPSPYGWIEDIVWAGDGKALAFSISYDGYASHLWTAEGAGADWKLTRIARPDPVTYYGGLNWRGADRTLCYLGENFGRIHLYAVDKVKNGGQGKTRQLIEGDVVTQSFGFDTRGKNLVAVVETITHTNDIFLVKSADKLQRLTRVNPQVDTWKLPRIQHIQWTGADGDPCYGILELPPDYEAGDGPLPTIVELHGGPTSSTKYRLRLWIYGRALMASKGYALISPNYHGSTGYGDEFLEKLIGRENEVEVEDIRTGVRHLVDQGIADPERLGVMGWSNGGYLTNCMITAEPDMFKAASSGAGVLDMVLQWGIEDTPGHVINFVEGLPWEEADHYRKASPLFGLGKVKTPTLIHVGGNDPRVPPAHSRALYRALRHYLDVPVELVVYPGEPHGLTTHENRLAKVEWDLAWFKKYLLGEGED